MCGPTRWLFLSPHPLHYLLGYGLIGVFAIIGLVNAEAARDRSEIDRVAAGRAAVDLSAVQLAAPFDRRLADSAGDLCRRRIGLSGAARVESIAAGEATDAPPALHGTWLAEAAYRGRAVLVCDNVRVDVGGADDAHDRAGRSGFSGGWRGSGGTASGRSTRDG